MAAVDPTHRQADALAAEAERLARGGQPAAAARAWEQVLALAPDHGGALNFQGQAALARGDLAQAGVFGQHLAGITTVAGQVGCTHVVTQATFE